MNEKYLRRVKAVWQYGFLAITVGLLVWNLTSLPQLLRTNSPHPFNGVFTTLGLVFNHIVFFCLPPTLPTRVKVLATVFVFVWIAFVFSYMYSPVRPAATVENKEPQQSRPGTTGKRVKRNSTDFQTGAGKQAKLDKLLRAAGKGEAARVAELLNEGVGISEPDANGQTALMLAAANGHDGLVRTLLVDPKANPNLRNKAGKTAEQLAREGGHTLTASELANLK